MRGQKWKHGLDPNEGDVVKGSQVDLSWGTKVLTMELRDGIRCMDVMVYCPAVVSGVIALPFDQVFKESLGSPQLHIPQCPRLGVEAEVVLKCSQELGQGQPE